MSLSQVGENVVISNHYSDLSTMAELANRSPKYSQYKQQQAHKLIADCANKRDFEKLDALLMDCSFKQATSSALKKLLEDAVLKKDYALFGFLNIRGVYSTKAYIRFLFQGLLFQTKRLEASTYEALQAF